MPDIIAGIVFIHRRQMTADCNALAELPQIVTIQDIIEFRLAGKDDLNQFVAFCF
jgi:hypothetical protein